MSSILDTIPLVPIFPAKPRSPRKLALSGAKLIESLSGSEDHVREGMARVNEALEHKETALTPYEAYMVGVRLLTTPWLNAHIFGMKLCDEAKARDPAAIAKADAEIDAEAEAWPKA